MEFKIGQRVKFQENECYIAQLPDEDNLGHFVLVDNLEAISRNVWSTSDAEDLSRIYKPGDKVRVKSREEIGRFHINEYLDEVAGKVFTLSIDHGNNRDWDVEELYKWCIRENEFEWHSARPEEKPALPKNAGWFAISKELLFSDGYGFSELKKHLLDAKIGRIRGSDDYAIKALSELFSKDWEPGLKVPQYVINATATQLKSGRHIDFWAELVEPTENVDIYDVKNLDDFMLSHTKPVIGVDLAKPGSDKTIDCDILKIGAESDFQKMWEQQPKPSTKLAKNKKSPKKNIGWFLCLKKLWESPETDLLREQLHDIRIILTQDCDILKIGAESDLFLPVYWYEGMLVPEYTIQVHTDYINGEKKITFSARIVEEHSYEKLRDRYSKGGQKTDKKALDDFFERVCRDINENSQVIIRRDSIQADTMHLPDDDSRAIPTRPLSLTTSDNNPVKVQWRCPEREQGTGHRCKFTGKKQDVADHLKDDHGFKTVPEMGEFVWQKWRVW